MAGYQVVAPLYLKNRSLEPIADLPATLGLFVPTPTELRDSMTRNRGRTFDFLNIEAVFVERDSTESDLELGMGFRSADAEIVSAGVIYRALVNSSYSTFHIPSSSPEFPATCHLLQDRCDPLARAIQGPARSTPRFQLCKLKCLAKFNFDFPTTEDERMILLPVGFDPAIRVSFEDSSEALRLENVAGILGVDVAKSTSGTVQLKVLPDSLMLGRSLVTYLNSLLLLGSLLFAIFRVEEQQELPRRRA